jgi:hypothetical protein
LAFGTSQQIAVVPAPTPARHDAQAVGRIAECRHECKLIADYERMVARILDKLDHGLRPNISRDSTSGLTASLWIWNDCT